MALDVGPHVSAASRELSRNEGTVPDPGKSGDTAPISIVLASDRRYVRPLSVTLASIAAHAGRHPHRLFVLHDGFGSRLIGKIQRSVEGMDLTWLDARSPRIEALFKPDYMARSSLFRLRVEELLPSDLERVIYLDADVLVRRPLTELWSTKIDDKMVGAVRDPSAPWVSGVTAFPWSKLGIAPTTPYFNAGVLLIPLNLWRAADVGAQAMALLKECGFAHGDQCALNVILRDRWQPLDPQWNTQWGHLVDTGTLAWVADPEVMRQSTPIDPAIVHFNAGWMLRPWEPRCQHPFREEWLSMMGHTAWPRWHPSRNGKCRRALQRFKRAARALADDRTV